MKKSAPRLRLAPLLCALILLLPGCANLTARPIPAAIPVRPELPSLTATPDNGITMVRRDAAELLIYIEALERACGESR